ncbi:MAG: NAD(P)/FAD-dependent oxidoreductase [Clostridia bacterium]|nr:NAD(P)/FAD-dependent oxidoreductase [Clostridia bacterium]MDD4387246.1 NAD(P)/FAD-dependent oxidoreductase [Clostridia bacterium]
MLRLKEIKLPIDCDESELYKIACTMLHIQRSEIKELIIYKKSIDARDKSNIHFVYTLDLDIFNQSRFKSRVIKNIDKYPVVEVKRTSSQRPVIIGAGPAGLFAALTLAEAGLNPIIIEQGKKASERKKDVDLFWEKGEFNSMSNVQFGEGGAGTFSDGKLTTQINNPLCRKVLEEFLACKAPKEIMYNAKPHIGTDKLILVVQNMRKKIEALGGEFLFNEKVTDITIEDGNLKSITCSKVIETDTVVFAIGHSSRDTFEMMYNKGINMQQKPFSVGVRIEHLQSMINKSQYGELVNHEKLGAADYKLVYHGKDNRAAYTFCMCPGGTVVAASSEEGSVVTNGMSTYKRDGLNANSALVVGILPEDFKDESPLAGMNFQRDLEQKAFVAGGKSYKAPAQLVGDFLNGVQSTKLGEVKSTYTPGITFSNFDDILPEFITKTMKEALIDFDRKLKGFAFSDSLLTGVETRTSSPIRILRNEKFVTNINGIYPCGEGSGYAGGIMSSAVDGIKCANAILGNE